MALNDKMSDLFIWEPSIEYARKYFRKTNISYTLIRPHASGYKGVRNVSFSEDFAYLLNR